jgi:uncharacterized membrane protein YcaP (DUF421 family)
LSGIFNGLFSFGAPPLQLVLRSAAIYLALLLGLRLFGKREVGQFTLFDLVFVLLVANAVQPSMTGPDASLGGGLLIIATLLAVNLAVAWLRLNVPGFRRFLEPHATVVGRDGRWFSDRLKREGLTDDDLDAALREHGVEDVSETRLVALEPDGSLSVVPRDPAGLVRRRRRVRFVSHH